MEIGPHKSFTPILDLPYVCFHCYSYYLLSKVVWFFRFVLVVGIIEISQTMSFFIMLLVRLENTSRVDVNVQMSYMDRVQVICYIPLFSYVPSIQIIDYQI
jgi:hypothetical protein